MRVLMVTEKYKSAIWRMAEGIKKYNPHIQIDIIAVHPKRPDLEQIQQFTELAQKVDVLDFEYWKSFVYLRDNVGIPQKPKILTHHNPYNIFEEPWNEFNKLVVLNSTMYAQVKHDKRYTLIRHTVDVERFPFQREYPETKNVLMVAARIEDKKGILEVAKICKKLGLKLILVGSISKKDYFDEVMAVGSVEFREKIPDEELYKTYCESAVLVCNSIDDFESGPLPVLEAMCVGVPVLTRKVGQIPDLYNGKNMVIRKGAKDDIDDLEKKLSALINDRAKCIDMREAAWQTAKTRDDVRRAREYEKLWWSILSNGPLVSVIIPTFNRKEILSEVLQSIVEQDYPAIEIIVCDDGSTDGTDKLIQGIQDKIFYPIKYVNTDTPDEYNLARAKNLGVIESSGKILVFLDDRYKLKAGAINQFVAKLYPKKWLFGDKGKGKQSFIENFSCIFRQEFINAGMFNESCKLYGFQSQELRDRFSRQGFKLEFVEAEAEQLTGTKNKYKKKDEIRKSKNILYKMGF